MTFVDRPIVVPIDFSPAAGEAYTYALRIARATGARVHLLHVVAGPDTGPVEVAGKASMAAQEEAEENAHALKALTEAAGDAYRAGNVELAVRRSAVPALGITTYVRDVEAGLIVMGTHGRRAWRPFLGSVAAEVVQTAPCDVLLVPHREESPFSQLPVRHVLIPVDVSGAARPLITLGVELAHAFGSERVDLLHVLEPLPYPVRWVEEAVHGLVPTIRDRAETALHDLAASAAREEAPPVAVHVERGGAARTVARAAVALGADLIVVGPHSERPPFDRLLGSVAEGVVRRAPCPVLVARRTAAPGGAAPFVDPWSYEPVAETKPAAV